MPKKVEIKVDGDSLWVSVDGECALHVPCIEHLVINDLRSEPESPVKSGKDYYFCCCDDETDEDFYGEFCFVSVKFFDEHGHLEDRHIASELDDIPGFKHRFTEVSEGWFISGDDVFSPVQKSVLSSCKQWLLYHGFIENQLLY